MELARALATNPSLLLLDEVMAGLNPTDCQGVVDLILKIRHVDHPDRARHEGGHVPIRPRVRSESGRFDLAGDGRGSHERSGCYIVVFGGEKKC